MNLVLADKRPYRKIAQDNWGLTDEQMKGMHVHHRLPTSKGGTNDPSNLYVCSPWFHAHVWHSPTSPFPMTAPLVLAAANRRGIPRSSEDIEKIKAGRIAAGGWHHTKETKELISKKQLGRRHSKETKQKMRKSHLGVNNTDEHNANISKAKKGVSLGPCTEKRKELLSAHFTGYDFGTVECPHCGKTGAPAPMKRWHFDNCKH